MKTVMCVVCGANFQTEYVGPSAHRCDECLFQHRLETVIEESLRDSSGTPPDDVAVVPEVDVSTPVDHRGAINHLLSENRAMKEELIRMNRVRGNLEHHVSELRDENNCVNNRLRNLEKELSSLRDMVIGMVTK